MTKWQIVSSKVLHETHWIKLREDKVLNHRSTPLTYTYLELQNPSVFIIAMDARGNIALQRVYRHTIKQMLWEAPAGFVEKGEAPLAAAKRELREETGLVSNEWSALGNMFQAVGTSNAPAFVFLAKNVESVGGATDIEEDIKTCSFFDFETVNSMIKKGELKDTPVIAALYMAKLHI